MRFLKILAVALFLAAVPAFFLDFYLTTTFPHNSRKLVWKAYASLMKDVMTEKYTSEFAQKNIDELLLNKLIDYSNK